MGFTAYLWDLAPQDRLLTETLAPLIDALRREGKADRFHFDRFDARGRHVYGFVSAAPEDADTVRDRLDAALSRHMASVSKDSPVSHEERRTAHDQCRGTVVTPADALPGLAEEGSYLVYDQDVDHVALGRIRALDDDALAEAADLLDDLDGWLLERIRAVPHDRRAATAVLWVAAVDQALGAGGADTEGYWRYHVSTLMLRLEDHLATDAAATREALRKSIGDANRRVFESLWEKGGESDRRWPGLPRLVELCLREAAAAPPTPWGLLREVDHTVLRQLGIPVRLQKPFVLHAWLRGESG